MSNKTALNEFLVFIYDTFCDMFWVIMDLYNKGVLSHEEYALLNMINSNKEAKESYLEIKISKIKNELKFQEQEKEWLFWAFLNKEKYNAQISDETLKNRLQKTNKWIIYCKVLIKQLNQKLHPDNVMEFRNTYGQSRKLG